jgi:hypothetical protein
MIGYGHQQRGRARRQRDPQEQFQNQRPPGGSFIINVFIYVDTRLHFDVFAPARSPRGPRAQQRE